MVSFDGETLCDGRMAKVVRFVQRKSHLLHLFLSTQDVNCGRKTLFRL